MIGYRVLATDSNNNKVEGKIIMSFQDALASGTRDYISVTYLSLLDDNNNILNIRPRDVIKVFVETPTTRYFDNPTQEQV
jgi:hypothetical protein